MNELNFMASSYNACATVLFGIGNACGCLCNFPENRVQQLNACTLHGSGVSVHNQWRICAASGKHCGSNDVVVVHGRSLRGQ